MLNDYSEKAGEKSASMTENNDFIVGKSFVIEGQQNGVFSPKAGTDTHPKEAEDRHVDMSCATSKIFDTLHNVQPQSGTHDIDSLRRAS